MRERYLSWMFKIVDMHSEYEELLEALDCFEFTYSIPMDANRYEDGIDLRYKFANEMDIHYAEVASALDPYPCSVLEMMVALALDMEEVIGDVEHGNRVPKWFWQMIENMGLNTMTNENFDPLFVKDTIDRMLNREYDYDGQNGGMFYVPWTTKDLKEVELWYQAMWYLQKYI